MHKKAIWMLIGLVVGWGGAATAWVILGEDNVAAEDVVSAERLRAFNESEVPIEGVFGPLGGWGWVLRAAGVAGHSETYIGVYGTSNAGTGVRGESDTGPGVLGFSDTGPGVKGEGKTGPGVLGSSETGPGVQAESASRDGVVALAYADHKSGVYAVNTNPIGYAAYFTGRTHVNGQLSKASGGFKIDHPLEPEDRYLYHSFVESPDMMNVYNGNVTTDGAGYAVIELADWFEALNRDFRYQLTVIDEHDSDEFVMAKVVRGVEGNSFVVRTSAPFVDVSWQLTGIRQDPYANDNRIPVEETKPEHERGHYLHPESYGRPDELRIGQLNLLDD